MISDQDLQKIARLASLELDQAERQRFTDDLSAILTYVESLQELELDDVNPLSHVQENFNVFRADEVRDSFTVEQALANAASCSENFFEVPLVIDSDEQ